MRTQTFKHSLAIAALLSIAFLFAAEVRAELFQKTLSNGLKVIVKEDHRAPVIVQQIWYHVGSMDENVGVTGIAHALEHMMFKGTKNVPVGQFSKRISAAGGRENAFTSNDYTAYFQQLHKSKLALAMQLESDRMQHLKLTDEEFVKEIKVVMEERRMRTDDEPHALMNEKLMAAAYQEHPYRHPVIGWMSDLKTLSANDAKTWYKNWYAPNNATLVIAGDVKANEVFALAQRFYGSIPARKLPIRKHFTESPQLGIKHILVKAPAQLPQLLMAYHTPSLRDPGKDWKPYALQILAGILDGNASARLNRALVREQQLASDVGVEYTATSRGPSLFILEGTPSEGKSVTALEDGLREQISILKRDGINEDELKRIKSQVTASEVYKLDSLFYQAMQIGQLESIGLAHTDIPLFLKKLQAVTAQQVQEVAKEFLLDDQLTIVTLEPQPLSAKKQQGENGVHHVH